MFTNVTEGFILTVGFFKILLVFNPGQLGKGFAYSFFRLGVCKRFDSGTYENAYYEGVKIRS